MQNTQTIGLTTGQAPFIEQAQNNQQLFIQQPYHLYSKQNQETWVKLYKKIQPKWEKFACQKFLQGVQKLGLGYQAIPKLQEINEFLKPLSGFKAKAVSGYVPSYLFFNALRTRNFPTTITIRDGKQLDYLPEPDIFHDIAGHVPMHTDPVFSDVLVRFGELARNAALDANTIKDPKRKIKVMESRMKAMARFFWFTIEFGLMRQGDTVKAYGSGLLSSAGELEYCLTHKEVQKYPIQLQWVVNQSFEIDRYQSLLFIVDCFDHLYQLVDQLEQSMIAGQLDNVAPGEPAINEEDLASFLDAGSNDLD